MTRRSVEVVERKRAASRGGDGALSFVVVCASPSVTPTLRVHRHRATQRLLSRCAPSFRGRRPRPFEFTRPPPGHGRGPRCVSSGTFTVDLVGRPSTSPRFQPSWCSHALRWTPSCHLAAHYRSVGEVDNRLVFSLAVALPHYFHDGCRVSEGERTFRVTSLARSLLWQRWGRQRSF